MKVIIPTAAALAGLMDGYKIARLTKVRALGGLALAAGGAAAFAGWKKNAGSSRAAALTGIYLGAFGYSHALHKKIGPWPAVCTVSAVTALASLLLGREKK